MTREEARRGLKQPSTRGVNATPLNVARPGRFDLPIDEAAELHVSVKVIRQCCEQHLIDSIHAYRPRRLPNTGCCVLVDN
jgi:hypothetical protein